MGSDRIINNTQDRPAGTYGLLINKPDHTGFEDILNPGAVPFPMIQEMCDGGSVALAGPGKINRFAFVSKKEDGEDDSHQMVHVNVRQKQAEI